MVKQFLIYQCEICDYQYQTREQAIQCESNGKQIPLASVGDLAEYQLELDCGYMAFDVRISRIEQTGHYITYHFEEEYDNGKWHETMHEAYGNDGFEALVKLK